jgi:hypothetical protein
LAVSADSVERALRIYEALFNAVGRRGYNVKVIDNRVYVIIERERISVHLKERTTKKLVKDHERSQYSYHKYKYLPNGNLTLTLRSEAEQTKHTWKDKPDQQLEDQLNDIYIGMLTHAALAPSSRAARLERERELEERQRAAEVREMEEQNKRYIFRKRKEQLHLQVEAWHKSCNLRLFLNQCEASIQGKGECRPKSIGRWLEWSRAYADSFDPTKNGQLQMLISQFEESELY